MTGRVLLAVLVALLTISSYSQNLNAGSVAYEAALKVAAFRRFTAENNIAIDVREERYRVMVFNDNEEKIKRINAAGKSYKVKINKFAVYTNEELKRMLNTFQIGPQNIALPLKAVTPGRHLQIGPVPTEKNWTAEGGTTAVRDQGQCGSCYAFATLAAGESAILIDYGTAVDLSEQQIVDCTTDRNSGCDGGSVFWSLVYSNQNGIVTEATYPYTATDTTDGNTCRFN